VGARVAHFDQTVDDRCTFCRILYPPVQTREDFFHLFRSCPITEGLIQNLIKRLRLNIKYYSPGTDPESKFEKLYWYGTQDNKTDVSSLLVFELFRYILWKFKTRRRLPRIIEVKDIFLNMLEIMIAIKPKLRSAILHNGIIANILQALG
jgi:hypothetical protein